MLTVFSLARHQISNVFLKSVTQALVSSGAKDAVKPVSSGDCKVT